MTETTTYSPTIFAHLADLHLAPRAAAVSKNDPITGRKIRDLDMTKAFTLAVDDIIAQDPRPSACVIAGDIFDTYDGSQDAIIDAAIQIKRLSNAGIEVVAIAGNHDTPTQRKKTPAYVVLKHEFEDIAEDKNVHLAYDTIEHVVVGDVEYVLLPHTPLASGAKLDLDALKPSTDAKYKVLVVHGVAEGDPAFRQMDEMKEVSIAPWIMEEDWDYVAFGHFHKPGWIPNYEGKAAYCGSLENTVISGPDVSKTRGPVYVDVTKKGKSKITMHPQPIRQIITLPDLDVNGTDINAAELDKMIEELIQSNDLDDAIVLHTVKNVAKTVLRALTRRSWQAVNPKMLYIRTKFEAAKENAGYIVQKTDEDGNVIEEVVDENGNIVEDIIDPSEGFKPLSVEVYNKMEDLIKSGIIQEARKDAVKNILTSLMDKGK